MRRTNHLAAPEKLSNSSPPPTPPQSRKSRNLSAAMGRPQNSNKNSSLARARQNAGAHDLARTAEPRQAS